MNYESLIEEALMQMPKGAFLTTGDTPNVMTIGWCQFGIVWGKPVCTVFVRESRFSHECIKHGYFTVSVPENGTMTEALKGCASCSGRDINKLEKFSLELMPHKSENAVDGIKGCSIFFECKVISQTEMDVNSTDNTILNHHYIEVNGKKDMHTIYFGEILNCYKA